MADIVQTYILKVNIGCCNACPRTLQKLLLKNKGVEKFEVDQEKSIVSVTGKIDLYQLTKDIKKKIKKNAELISKESIDSEKKKQSEQKESTDSGKKQPSQESQEHMAPSPYQHPYTVQMPPSPYHHPYTLQPPPPLPYHHPYAVQMPPPFNCYGYPYQYN